MKLLLRHSAFALANKIVINLSLSLSPKQHPPLSNSSNDTVTSNNTADKRPEAAQVVEPALTS